MKTALRSLGILSTLGVIPLACEVHEPDLAVVNQFCAQAGWTYNEDGEVNGSRFEFLPIGVHPDTYGKGHPDGTAAVASGPGATGGATTEKVIKPPAGSFESTIDEKGAPLQFWVKAGTLIADDDDLTDDLPGYQAALALATELLEKNPEVVATYKNMDPDPDIAEGDRSEKEQQAILFVADVVAQLLPMCPRLGDADATGVPPRPGDDLLDGTFPSFTACKDKYDDSGDGIVGTFDLLREDGAAQDAELAQCLTSTAGVNRTALNVWGPLTTRESKVDGLPPELVDGFTYSGITVPLETSAWKRTFDRSEWEGVSFWARVATAGEAVDIGPTPGAKEPLAGAEIPNGARPQDGVGQVGIIVQTFDTGAVYNERGEMDFMNSVGLCPEGLTPETFLCFETQEELDAFPGEVAAEVDGVVTKKYAYADEGDFNPDPSVNWGPGTPSTPPSPFCQDYSPVDIIVGEEPSYRDHCWDGFRTMVDVGPEWKYYFLPFDEMRQAGWGRVAESFRTDQIRSVNILTSAYQPVNIMVDEISYYRSRKSDKAKEAAEKAALSAGGATD